MLGQGLQNNSRKNVGKAFTKTKDNEQILKLS